MNNDDPIVILGAGPAGLAAGLAAAERGARVVVVEQLDKPGVKLLATGGGRCNVTNLCESEAFMVRVGRQGRFLREALAALDSRGVVELLARLDVPTVADGLRVYPASHSAATVQQALVRRARELGVEFRMGTVATDVAAFACGAGVPPACAEGVSPSCPAGILPARGGDDDWMSPSRQTNGTHNAGETPAPRGGAPFTVALSRAGRVDVLRARAVIVATGGRSYAKLGGTGGGYELARRFGHTITPLTPALVGLVTREDWVRKLAGVSLPARVSLAGVGVAGSSARSGGRSSGGAAVRGDLLFTHHGLSGPAVLDLSGDIAQRLAEQKEVPLAVTLADPPDEDGPPPDAGLSPTASPSFAASQTVTERQASWMRAFSRWQSRDGTKAVATMLARHLPARLTSVLCELAAVDGRTVCAHLPGDARRKLAAALSAVTLTAVATDGWEKAMVTRGGVSLKPVNPRTMASRLVEGLYFAGEVLDLDGPSGGFNLQIAFSTGWLAGLSASSRSGKP